MKAFEALTKKCENKFKLFFSVRQLSEQEGLKLYPLTTNVPII